SSPRFPYTTLFRSDFVREPVASAALSGVLSRNLDARLTPASGLWALPGPSRGDLGILHHTGQLSSRSAKVSNRVGPPARHRGTRRGRPGRRRTRRERRPPRARRLPVSSGPSGPAAMTFGWPDVRPRSPAQGVTDHGGAVLRLLSERCPDRFRGGKRSSHRASGVQALYAVSFHIRSAQEQPGHVLHPSAT